MGKQSENTDFQQGTARRIIPISPAESWDLQWCHFLHPSTLLLLTKYSPYNEDATEISGSTGGHAKALEPKDQVHCLSQPMMVPAPIGGFDGSAVLGFLARYPSFHAILFLYDPDRTAHRLQHRREGLIL